MPNRDGTGPQGKGPKTGRGLGPCSEDKESVITPRMGLGRGLGIECGRRQRRFSNNNSDTSEQEN